MDGLSGVLVTDSSVKDLGFLSSLLEVTAKASSFFACGRLLEGLILLSATASSFLGVGISTGAFTSCAASFGSSILLFLCSNVLLPFCSIVPLFLCSIVPLFLCSIVLMFTSSFFCS